MPRKIKESDETYYRAVRLKDANALARGFARISNPPGKLSKADLEEARKDVKAQGIKAPAWDAREDKGMVTKIPKGFKQKEIEVISIESTDSGSFVETKKTKAFVKGDRAFVTTDIFVE